VGLDEPEILVHPRADLREDIRGALVAELVGLIDGVTGTLTIGASADESASDVVPLLLAASPPAGDRQPSSRTATKPKPSRSSRQISAAASPVALDPENVERLWRPPLEHVIS